MTTTGKHAAEMSDWRAESDFAVYLAEKYKWRTPNGRHKAPTPITLTVDARELEARAEEIITGNHRRANLNALGVVL